MVDQRRQGVCRYVEVILHIDSAGEARVVVAGIADHRQNFACTRFHGNYRTRLADDSAFAGVQLVDARSQSVFGGLLQVDVDSGYDLVSWYRIFSHNLT